MTESRRVLVTGNRGYIGSVLAPHLVRAGYDVVGLDVGYFDDCTLVPDEIEVPTVRSDLRDVRSEHLRGVDAVVHLAALSNDPIGNLNARWTGEINHDATIRLAELAKEAGVTRFLFSSSCIMYGLSGLADVDETAPLDPKTEYARSKVRSERSLSELADDRFSPTFLRNGTIYGLSPRMRFDTVLNDFVGAALTTKLIRVHGDGTPWRPVVHVEDVARAFEAALRAPLDDIHNEAFNTGADELNYQVIELAQFAREAVPGSEIEVLAARGADQRTYRADFGKWRRTFPGFEFKWDARRGAQELARALSRLGLTHDQYAGPTFTRLSWLSQLLDSRAVDDSLRWAA